MKIESAEQFRKLLRTGLTKVFVDGNRVSDKQIEGEQVLNELQLNLEAIARAYNKLETDEARRVFEKHLTQSVNMYLDKWRDASR